MIPSNIKAMRNSLKFNINIRSKTTTSSKTCDPTSKSVSQKTTEAGATINIDLYYVLWGGCQETSLGVAILLEPPKAFMGECKRVVIWLRVFQRVRLVFLKDSPLRDFQIIQQQMRKRGP
jgi:hypothetical protein